ncbi:beta-lactamase/transpeptidase-like protein [Viridothelium virens]|uniref:Beta-lactamase/transpeptidase-like protein n=1 Tax=Viridothelium virens TaxID=1048519 RepID=A0A6A6GUZ0_VIRVR|nr:beta-lactamase/transpeptidase-like protein [Viridothelium virens]
MAIWEKAQSGVKATLDSVTSDPKNGVPGMVFAAVDKKGSIVASHASGKLGLYRNEPMSMDSVFWIASCTKMITGIACMQLVEQGKLSLDDAGQLYKVLPELTDKKYLNDQGQLEPKQGEITLEMLLTHTAGFGYTLFNEKLRNYGRPIGFSEFNGDVADFMNMPLVNQPGTRWEYGINLDWAGIAVERVSGLSLNDYFQKHIFGPLGITEISMFPSEEMKARLASMHQTDLDGSVRERDHIHQRAMTAKTDHEKKHIFNSGGAGCFAKPTEYCKILATLLNNGTSPTTNAQILKPETVDNMFRNHIPQFPDFGRQGIAAAKPELTNALPDVYPQEGNPPQGWGLSFFISTDESGKGKGTGRSNGTVHWAGLPNLFWWCDRENGVAGIIASQIVPFANMQVLGSWAGCEKAVYDSLHA